jgi:uncharacterized protein YndB with AHSA1/START domain
MALAGALAVAAPAAADVVDAQPYGFKVESKADVAAPPDKVWAALGRIGRWWSPDHTWSHDAANLSLELKVGGCFCETFPGGGVRHQAVVYVKPGETLVLDGAMGPMMFSGTGGRTIWSLAAAGGHTTVTETFYAGGYFPGGLDKLAPVVDRVFTEQLHRLKSYVETGKPAS